MRMKMVDPALLLVENVSHHCLSYLSIFKFHAAIRILRFLDTAESRVRTQQGGDRRHATGQGRCRIESTRNFWEGSPLRVDSSQTDVAWGRGGQ